MLRLVVTAIGVLALIAAFFVGSGCSLVSIDLRLDMQRAGADVIEGLQAPAEPSGQDMPDWRTD